MNTIITVAMKGFNGDYILEEKENGDISVQVPYIDQDEENVDVLEHNIVDIPKGKKADVVRQFFKESSPTIIREGIAYNIDPILFDESDLPNYIAPDTITP